APVASRLAGQPVTQWLDADAVSAPEPPTDDLMVGRLVHRLFQFPDVIRPGASDEQKIEAVRALLTGAELEAIADLDAATARALATWSRIRARGDVATWLSSGRAQSGVPFSVVGPSGARGVLR